MTNSDNSSDIERLREEHVQALRELQDARNMLQLVMDNIPQFIFWKDHQSTYMGCNQNFAEVAGIANPRDIVGKTDFDLPWDRKEATFFRKVDRRVMDSCAPEYHIIEPQLQADGKHAWVDTNKVPLVDADGRVIGILGTFEDITERILAEEELKRHREHLEELVDERTKQLVAANEELANTNRELEIASRAKSDFLANMSHEIRTPMNAIIGMTDLLLETKLTDTQREYLGMVEGAGDALLTLINDILDFSKIEAGKLELDIAPFNIADTIGDAMKLLALRAFNNDLELAFAVAPDVPALLLGDPGRLRQIVINLVGNAIKFTPEGEVVLEVTTHSVRDSQAVLQFEIRDTGIGIPEHKLASIFEEFEQADSSTTRNFGGTGLGLAISARLVELMGGHIDVTSEVGRGSTFRFTATFEIRKTNTPESRTRGVEMADMPILIVDDNSTNRRILTDMLTNWAAKPHAVSGAREAIAALRESGQSRDAFRLVLSDLNMPDVDGLELAKWIRADPALQGLPIILLTSSGRISDEERSGLRIQAQLVKPIKQSELFDAILASVDMKPFPDLSAEDIVESDDAGQRPLRVLLAEDNRVNQKLAVGILKQLGHAVTVANNGREAVEHFGSTPFDVVLMDVQMPEMDGFEAVRRIRQCESRSGRQVPIIAMTAHAMQGDRERCLDAGMSDYLPKPIRKRELKAKLSGLAIADSAVEVAGEVAGDSGESTEIVDWTEALATAGGDPELMNAIIDAFLKEFDSLMEKVRCSITDRDIDALKAAAHTLKGTMLSIGAKESRETAERLEMFAMEGDMEGAEQAFSRLEPQATALLKTLRTHRSTEGSAGD